MILGQLRREPSLRVLVWYLPAAVVLGVAIQLLLGPRDFEPVLWSDEPRGLYPGLFIVWSCLVTFLLNAGVATRGPGPLEPVLPLSPRRVWTVHVLSMVLGVLAILTTIGGVVALGNALQRQQSLIQPALITLGVNLAAGFILTVALLQTPRPELYRRSVRGRYAGLLTVCLGVYFALVLLMSAVPVTWALVPVAIALLLGIWTYSRLPASFSLVGRAPVRPSRPAAGVVAGPVARESGSARGWWRLHFALWRNPVGNWVWFYPAILGFHGFILSWGGSYDQRIPYVFFALTILLAWTMIMLRRLYIVDPWPVSRRHVLAVMVWPMLLSLAIGYGAGAATRGLRLDTATPIDFRVDKCCYSVYVPNQHWETASTSQPPTIDSPWGESFEPRLYPLSAWTETAIYNPYDTPFGSSVDLVALQISRAVEAVTGRNVPYETIRDRYLSTADDGKVVLGQGFTLPEELSAFDARPPTGMFPVTLTIVGVPWLLLATVAFRSRPIGDRGAAVFFAIVFALIVLCGIAFLIADSLNSFEHWVASWWLGIVLERFTSSLRLGGLIVWVGCLAVLAAAYALAQRQFEQMEAAACPSKGSGT